MDFQKCKIISGAVKLAHIAVILYPSTVPLQEKVDSEDSALYVCRYAYNMLAMAGQYVGTGRKGGIRPAPLTQLRGLAS